MRAIRQKLHSQRGASLLMALLFFLLASMVGAVILAAAGANADKMASRRQEQQDYLAISSAARFLQDTIGGTVCEAAEYERIYSCPTTITNLEPAYHPRAVGIRQEMTVSGGDGQLQTALAALADQIFRSQTEYQPKKPLPAGASSVTAAFTIEAEGMNPVSAELTMAKNYDLALRLSMEAAPYLLILNLPNANLEPPQSVTLTPEPATCHHEWDSEGQAADGTPTTIHNAMDYPITDHVKTTTVKWARGSIGKGVATDG